MSEPGPIEIFCCAAQADWPFLEKLSKQLGVQRRQGIIQLWDKSQVPPGKNADEEIQQHSSSARIFLLLISPDFLNDNYCSNTVMEAALKRHEYEEATIIPVFVRPSNWDNVPVLKDIQGLPRDSQPISSQSEADQEIAIWKVAREIEGIIENLPAVPVRRPMRKKRKQKQSSLDVATILILIVRSIATTRWGWAFIGAIVLLSGVLWGASSPTVPYIATPEGNTPLIVIPQNRDLYISAPENPSTFFIAHCNELLPSLDCTKFPLPNTKLGFFARPEPISVNNKIRDDVTGRDLQVSQAYVIEELDVSDQNGSRTAYKASDYASNHNYYINRWWPISFALIGSGLLIAYVALFVRRKRRGDA